MATILKGMAVVNAMKKQMQSDVEKLSAQGIVPTLGIVRVGEREDDIAYERGATKRCQGIGVAVKNFVLPNDATQAQLISVIDEVNAAQDIHGVLLFRPLPKHIDDAAVCARLDPKKDVDGITDISMVDIYAGGQRGYAPCTAQACMEILKHYQYDVTGKRAVVIGRSLVVGKPVTHLLIAQNATVTVCHTRTVDMPSIAKQADILIVAAGRAGVIGEEYLLGGQVVIDVGINVDEKGKLCGDVDFAAAENKDIAITPVPGGVGTVTTSVLVRHVIDAALKTL